MQRGRPLRQTVPALIFLVGSLLIAGYLLLEHSRLTDRIFNEGRQDLRSFASLASGELESAFRRGDVGEARGTIERLGSIPPLQAAALVWADGTVLSAAEPGHDGEFVADLLTGLELAQVREILATETIHIAVQSSQWRQFGFFPIRLRGETQSVYPERLGWLVITNDLSHLAAQQRFDLLLSALPYVVALLASCLGLWWLFTRKLLYRIRRLASASRAIAMGDFSARANIGGNDELYQLSVEFAEMARRLEQNTSELIFLGGHDRLTGLLNRRGFEQKLDACTHEANVLSTKYLLLYIDIDSFRVINDTQGHVAGDSLIADFAQHLQHIAQHAIVLARIGGDEFAVLLAVDEVQNVKRTVEGFHRQASDFDFEWERQRFNLQLSIGAVIVDGEATASETLSRADTACYTAKAKGRNRVQVWHANEQTVSQHHGEMKWVGRIQSALEGHGFELYGQPIVSLKQPADKLHMEILLRYSRGTYHGSPREFLPAAERFQLSAQIDRWVIAHCFKILGSQAAYSTTLGTCAINLSGLSLEKDELLLDIQQGFKDYPSIQPHQLCFEITETAAITNLHNAVRFIQELRHMNCKIALDDFGSGLSSFGYLKNLPVDIIKIDGMFVRDILASPLDSVITRSINDIAHEMGKRTIAEYAESAAIVRELRRMGIDYAQGYGIARPAPLKRLLERNLAAAG